MHLLINIGENCIAAVEGLVECKLGTERIVLAVDTLRMH